MLIRRTIGAFWDDAFENPKCVRCEKRIQQHKIWKSENGDTAGGYAAIGQIWRKNRIEGGLLCEPCVVSFRQWVMEGETT
jgi:hypothetical protein